MCVAEKDSVSYFESKKWKTDLIEHFTLQNSLASYDPYDIWQTKGGAWIKKNYYAYPHALLPFAGIFALYDFFINNSLRIGYQKREYPIVLAFASQALANLYDVNHDTRYLKYQKRHLQRMLELASPGCKGLGWGLWFPNQLNETLRYEAETPYSTMTPYCMEALVRYYQITSEKWAADAIRKGIAFFLEDIQVMYEDQNMMATSYINRKDRIVVNAISYSMYMYALLQPWGTPEQRTEMSRRIPKMYEYIRSHQNEDGSWFYAPDTRSFIDCFHSCIVLKNLYKTHHLHSLSGCDDSIRNGYGYLKRNMYVEETGLCKRFSITNKPGIVKFDLYDNSEMLNLATILDDTSFADTLCKKILQTFCLKNFDVFSILGCCNIRKNKNLLRWAVMPLIYALSIRYKKDEWRNK